MTLIDRWEINLFKLNIGEFVIPSNPRWEMVILALLNYINFKMNSRHCRILSCI